MNGNFLKDKVVRLLRDRGLVVNNLNKYEEINNENDFKDDDKKFKGDEKVESEKNNKIEKYDGKIGSDDKNNDNNKSEKK